MLNFFRSQQAVNYALCILAFAIPLPYVFSSIAVIILLATWLLQIKPIPTLRNLKERKTLWFFILYFLLHAVSYTYSIDKGYSSFDLQRKLTFLLFPLVIGAGIEINRKLLERILLTFITSISLLAVFCIARAIFRYYTKGTTSQFFYHPLVDDLDANAVYCALYTLFSIGILLFYQFTEFKRVRKGVKIALLILLIVFFILLSSRTLIVVFFVVVLPYYLFYSVVRKGKGILFLSLIFLIFISLAVALFTTNNPVKKRYSDIINSKTKIDWTATYEKGKEKEFNNLSLRLFLWHVALENVKEHNLWLKGGGNGSATALQNKKFEELGIPDMNNEANRSPFYDINTHNMYLQTLLELGIPGLLTLLIIILSPFLFRGRPEIIGISCVLGFSTLILLAQESVFETQAGIIFYTFFAMVLYNYSCKPGGDQSPT